MIKLFYLSILHFNYLYISQIVILVSIGKNGGALYGEISSTEGRSDFSYPLMHTSGSSRATLWASFASSAASTTALTSL